MKITIETKVNAPLAAVWEAWITPADIVKWNYALDEWCCPKAEINLVAGGKFNYRMEAKDGSMGFDFEGIFKKVIPTESIHFELGDNRLVTVDFKDSADGVCVVETFDAENENSAEQQKQGWQKILNNFKKHVEEKAS
jgi:uncharacterized protein YndB with AHSA1/START domain